jgi:hypothetical protein
MNCSKCKKRKRVKYYTQCRKCINIVTTKYYKKLRNIIIDHYGGKCKCCGIGRIEFLTIEHKNGNGNKHRNKVGRGLNYYLWIIKNNFPNILSILCYNCNCSRGFYGYCPHKKKE